VVNNDWAFWSHRVSLARAMRARGAEVVVLTHVNYLEQAIKQEGFQLIPWHISSGSLNPFHEFLAFLQVLRVYRHERPDLVHHVTIKSVIYGGLAARLCGNIPSVNAITGLGHVFISQSWGMRLLRRLLLVLFRWVLRRRGSTTVFQNADNCNDLVKAGVVPQERVVLIRGSGVDVKAFSPRPEPKGVPVVILATRMLWEKGVGDFVDAAGKLREQGVSARFVLVGDPDPGNPACIPRSQLLSWAASGVVEWWGHRNDMPAVFAQSNVVCFPSYYGEGVPKVLIEAAACGRAIVTTDVPGCREVVRNGDNGLLVPAKDANALAGALKALILDPGLRAMMGVRGREIAVREFSEERVIRETLAVYRELLGPLSFGPLAEASS
jgi:glycosyltransferase involved in cell wall biosynthesis